MNIDEIKNILYNPFWCSKLIAFFLSKCPERSIKFELVFLLLPFVLNKDTRLILNKANENSTIDSLFFEDTEKKISWSGLDKRYLDFKKLTQHSLIVAANQNYIVIKNNIKAIGRLDYKNEPEELREYYKAAAYLGLLLSKNDYLHTFIKFGIKEL